MTDQPDLFNAYPVTPGYAPTDTSKAAAEAMKPKVGPLREQVLAVLAEGPATSFEIASRLRKSYAAIQPRTSELKDLGLIVDSGKRGISRDPRRQAIVWMVVTDPVAPATHGGA